MRIIRNGQLVKLLFLAVFVMNGTILLTQGNEAHQSGNTEPIWSLAATGNSIITRRISVFDDPALMKWVKLVREADVSFTNLEGSLFRLWEFKGYPQAEFGGTQERGSPEMAEELKWAGFDLINRANNHTTDWGVEGMVETNRLLDKLGLVHAGTGMNLGEASQAKYFETKKGRFGLIGLASSFTPMSRAGKVRSEVSGRPGLNPLRVDRRYQLNPERMADLRRIMSALGYRVARQKDGPVRFLGSTFVQGSENKIIQKANSRDVDRILRNVRSASKQADFVIVTSHSHASGKARSDPPEFILDFARKCIDAGATTYIIHGPHQVRGIEIYKGKPIFYGLGDFIFQYETTEPQGSDVYDRYGVFEKDALIGDLNDPDGMGRSYGPLDPEWWEGILVVPVFRGHQLIELKVYPVELGHKGPFVSGDGRTQRGTPRIAEGKLAKKIIDLVAKLSAPFGTRIVFQDGIGVWKPPTQTKSNQN